MMTAPGAVDDTAATPTPTNVVTAAPTPGKLSEDDVKRWRSRIERCKTKRRELAADWSINIDYRRGKTFDSESDVDRISVSVDWSQTKAKQAQLFSQLPQVLLTPKHPVFAPAVPEFAKKLNDTIERAGVGVAMDEVLPDVINAAGIGAVVIGYESRQQMKQVPSVDTALMPPATAALAQSQNQTDVPQVMDSRFYCRRVSPGDLIWDTTFRLSNFDQSPYTGYSGRMTWGEAQPTFNLTDEQKDKVVGAATVTGTRTEGSLAMNTPTSAEAQVESDVVEFDEVYYWAYRFDPTCLSFTKIRRVVFVRGLDAPVIDEDYKGQRPSTDGSYYIGVTRLPVQILTLTYISDEAIPPSDTAIGRPQVDELIKSRSQMVQQRDYSMPMRWFDVNRTDPTIVDRLMKGEWQGMIPVNGDGARAIGEVARASHPPEDFEFDRIIKDDLMQAWQIGPNQQGAFNPGERSASEANIVQANFSTRIGYERARVSDFFCRIAEVLGGLVALYGDFSSPDLGQDGQQRMQAWDRKAIGNCFVYEIRTDSTVLLDSHQRMQKLQQFLDLTAKSGFVNIEPVLREMASLAGLDPDNVIQKPNPKGPEPPTVSIKVDSETVRDPIILAILVHNGMAPGPQDMEAAKQILINKVEPPQSSGPHDGAALGAPPPPGAGGPPPPPGGKLPAPPPSDPTPKWNLADRINKRMNDGSNS